MDTSRHHHDQLLCDFLTRVRNPCIVHIAVLENAVLMRPTRSIAGTRFQDLMATLARPSASIPRGNSRGYPQSGPPCAQQCAAAHITSDRNEGSARLQASPGATRATGRRSRSLQALPMTSPSNVAVTPRQLPRFPSTSDDDHDLISDHEICKAAPGRFDFHNGLQKSCEPHGQ